MTEVKNSANNDREPKISERDRQRAQLKDEEARLGRLYFTGKITEETYNQLRREWQEKLRHLELTIAELEREVTFHLDDLDATLALMAKLADLYIRLDKQKQSILLQILAKQIIVDSKGQIVGHVLNSPFVYLRSLVQNLSISGIGNSGPEHVGEGLYPVDTTGRNSQNVEELLAALRFEQRGKLELVPINNTRSHT